MKKSNLLTCLILFGIFVNIACDQTNEPNGIDYNEYFPIAEGNYWIYETNCTYENHDASWSETFYDTIEIGGIIDRRYKYKTYELIYKTGDTSHISKTQSNRITNKIVAQPDKVFLLGNAYSPFLFSEPLNCICPGKGQMIPIAGDVVADYSFSENIEGDKYPSLVTDPSSPSGYKTVWTITEWDIDLSSKFLGNGSISFNGESHDSKTYEFSITQYYNLIEPENVQFIATDNCVESIYSNDGRTIFAVDGKLELTYAKGIGIGLIESANRNACEWRITTRTLVDWKLN